MRLLHFTEKGDLIVTKFPNNKVPTYAILSHTWGRGEDDEVTFEDMAAGTGKQKPGYEKLLFCGQNAKDDDIHHFWVDTCCIDKTNVNELTTAINSMYKWYQNAERCYVLLSDVSVYSRANPAVHEDWQPAFRNSRWFSRGWTLQELIAPKIVFFFSKDHVRLGDKYTLRGLISAITGIGDEAFIGRRDISEFSIEERFSWAENRDTTIEEDKSYCLLGIFNVFLPLIYAEGRINAERRLRREIRESMSADFDRQTIMNEYRSPKLPPTPIIQDIEHVYIAVMGPANAGKSLFIRGLTDDQDVPSGMLWFILSFVF